MSDIVVDSSVVAKWVLPEADSAIALELVADARAHGDQLVVLDLAFPEVGNAICTRYHRGSISADEARDWLDDVLHFPVRIEPAMPLMGRALEIALQYRRALYDALFVALAESFNAVGITADAPLFNAISGHFPRIKLLGRA